MQHRRSKRSVKSKKRKNGSKSSSRVNQLLQQRKKQKGCSRHTLYVTFKELRWDEWILQPSGYGAYYCAGSCDFPFQHYVEATNHAVIQELAHLFQSHAIPKPCCAPSELQAVQLLYLVNETTVSLKRYRDMIATKCACQ